MRKFGLLKPGFWSSPTVKALDDQGKLLASYLVAGPHTTLIGAFYCPVGYIMVDLGWDEETVTKQLRNCCRNGFCSHDKASGWVMVCKYLKHNPLENPNQVKSAVQLFEQIPENVSIRAQLARALLNFCTRLTDELRNSLETVAEQYRNQEQEQEKEQYQEQYQSTTTARSSSDQPRALMVVGPNKVEEVVGGKEAVVWIPALQNKQVGVTRERITEWSEAYPAIDVEQQLRAAREWCLANDKNTKTAGGVPRFLVGWLNRAQNSSRPGNGNGNGTHGPVTLADKAKRSAIDYFTKHHDEDTPF